MRNGRSAPLVTISLVTHNAQPWLAGCLDSIRRQDLGAWELLALDNASSDNTLARLREIAGGEPRASVIESQENLGFAKAHNRNILAARGTFVLLLNQDVELEPGFLSAAVGGFEGRPAVAAIQARLRRLTGPGDRTDVLDSTGLVMHRDRRVVSRRQGQREGPADLVPGPVWGADGPAPVYRRAALLHACLPRRDGRWEILDEEFFMYKEDVDLAWRLRLLGWQAWYEPSALAWHARSARGSAGASTAEIARASLDAPLWVRTLSWRNQRLMQLKNERLAEVGRDLPALAWRELFSLGFLLVADRGRLAALPGLARLLPATLWKRPYVHRRARPPQQDGHGDKWK